MWGIQFCQSWKGYVRTWRFWKIFEICGYNLFKVDNGVNFGTVDRGQSARRGDGRGNAPSAEQTTKQTNTLQKRQKSHCWWPLWTDTHTDGKHQTQLWSASEFILRFQTLHPSVIIYWRSCPLKRSADYFGSPPCFDRKHHIDWTWVLVLFTTTQWAQMLLSSNQWWPGPRPTNPLSDTSGGNRATLFQTRHQLPFTHVDVRRRSGSHMEKR